MEYIVVKDVIDKIHILGFRSSEDFLEELAVTVAQIIEASALNAEMIDRRTTLQPKDIPLVRMKPKSVIVQDYQNILYKLEYQHQKQKLRHLHT